jgi:choline dehydrogenase
LVLFCPYLTIFNNVPKILFLRFAKCAEVMGFVHIADTSAPDAPADGLATHDVTVNAKNQRVSTFDAFLPRQIALARKNLTICTKVIVSQISFRSEEKDSIAEQVLFRSTDPKSNKVYAAKVNKEVIVCSGSIGSPQVLMLRYCPILDLLTPPINSIQV